LDTAEFEDPYFQAYLNHYEITAVKTPLVNGCDEYEYTAASRDILQALIHDHFALDCEEDQKYFESFITKVR